MKFVPASLLCVVLLAACGQSGQEDNDSGQTSSTTTPVPALPATPVSPTPVSPDPAPAQPASTGADITPVAPTNKSVPPAVEPIKPVRKTTDAAPPTPPAAARADNAPADPPAPANLGAGRQTYQQACAFCHDKGVAGAPRFGDAAAWSARTAQGMETLYASALRGKGAMPAKGGNPSLSDAAVKAAVDYLIAGPR